MPGATSSQALTLLVKAYLGTLVDNDEKRQSAVGMFDHFTPFMHGKQEEVISVRAHPVFFKQLEQLAVQSRLSSPSDVFRRLVVLAAADPEAGRELKKLITLYA